MALLFQFQSVALIAEFLEGARNLDVKNSDKIIKDYAWTGTLNCAVAAMIYAICAIAAFLRIRQLRKRAAHRSEPEYPYKGRYAWYMIYDVGARSDNKITPQSTFF
ncbi:hypothetical protein M8J75_012407 [Diaphorina citri]|nr:hypothetical protein M8J75_012407 [Diaphorina citri]KAI5734518.1 hypothetical protein M8J77_007485 [Diaphorina citri]